MKIVATEEAVVEAAKKAIAASVPMGLGFLHFRLQDHVPDDAEVRECLTHEGIDIDYFRGRMVKFWLRRIGPDTWEAQDTVSPEYQSWCRKYPSYQALFEAEQPEAHHA